MKLQRVQGQMTIAVADGPALDSDVNCAGCHAPCCTSDSYFVFLTAEEMRRLPFQCVNVRTADGVEITAGVVLARHPITRDCVFLRRDGPAASCTIYDLRPAACRAYDCRNDARQDKLVQLRFGGARG